MTHVRSKRLNLGERNSPMNLRRIKQVYVVSGESNSGKTTILHALCDYLHTIAVEVDDYPLNSSDQCCKAKLPDGRVVGVGTAGDTAGLVIENFLYFSEGTGTSVRESGCDIVFIALTKNRSRHNRRYKPNCSSAEIAVYDVIFPAFMQAFTVPTNVVATKRYSQHYNNYQQRRDDDNKLVLQRLKNFIEIEESSNV